MLTTEVDKEKEGVDNEKAPSGAGQQDFHFLIQPLYIGKGRNWIKNCLFLKEFKTRKFLLRFSDLPSKKSPNQKKLYYIIMLNNSP